MDSKKILILNNSLNNNFLDQAANTLYLAFIKDPLLQWLFVSEENYHKSAKKVFKTWVNYSAKYGLALATPGFEAVAIRKKPGDTDFSLWQIIRSGIFTNPIYMGHEAFKRIEQFQKINLAQTKKNMSINPYWYCWMLGTKPEYQKQGFGKILMDFTFELAKKDGLPCYLETASTSSQSVHADKGYKILSAYSLLDSNITITSMLRKN